MSKLSCRSASTVCGRADSYGPSCSILFRCSIKEAVPDESIHDGLWWTLDLIGRTVIQVQQCQDDDFLGRTLLGPQPQLCPQFPRLSQNLHSDIIRGLHSSDHRHQQEQHQGRNPGARTTYRIERLDWISNAGCRVEDGGPEVV